MLNPLISLHSFASSTKISIILSFPIEQILFVSFFCRKRSHIYRYQLEQAQQPVQPMMIMTLMMDEHGQQQQQPMIMF